MLWFVIACLVMSLGEGQENAILNSPAAVAQTTGSLMTFGVIVLSAICGMAVCRDFEDDTYQLFFTTPLRRRDYLAGRLVGSLLVSLLVFTGITVGLLLAPVVPWADHAHMAPIRLWVYVQPYLLFIATMVCSAGVFFFTLGALTRSIVFVYLQGVLFVALYLGIQRLSSGNLNDFWPALADPFGFIAADQVMKYWTLAESNTRMIPVTGALLWNRVIWLAAGGVALAAVWRFFPFSAEAFAARRARRRRAIVHDRALPSDMRPIPRATLASGGRVTFASLIALTRLRVWAIVTDLPFIAIAVLTMVLDAVNGWGAPRMADTPVYPVTYLMTGNVGILMAVVITAIYAGELVWKERALKYDQIHDALPTRGWLNFVSQLAALASVQALILAAMMATGMAQQAAQGYFRFEVDLYLTELFLIQFSVLILYAVLALFLQTLLPNKFIGHAVVIGVAVTPSMLANLMDKWNVTVPAALYDFATTPEYTYSDMNGYGPFVRPMVWYTFYWSAFAIVLAAGALAFARRGTDTGLRVRWRQARRHLRAPLAATAGVALAAFVATGGYLYYDARVVNTDFRSRRVDEALRTRYEREFKQYETLPQPKITAVEVNVDVVPERASVTASGLYTLVNKTSQPIPTVHIVDWAKSIRELSFDRPFKETRFDKDLQYHIYEFTHRWRRETRCRPGSPLATRTTAFRTRAPRSSPMARSAGTDEFPSFRLPARARDRQ